MRSSRISRITCGRDSRRARRRGATSRTKCRKCAATRKHPERNGMITLNVNGTARDVDADPSTPLLYVLRDYLGMNGAKFGCGLGQCGACTVMVDREAVFSC